MKKIQKTTQRSLAEYIVIALIFIAMALMIHSFRSREFSYSQYNTENIEYVRGTVTEVVIENLSTENVEYVTGYQQFKVEILEGKAEGEIVVIDNYITATHNVIAEEGSRLIIYVDMPEGGIEPYYSVYNYDRTVSIFAVIAAFLLLVIIIGRKKGLMSCISLMFTVCTVVCVLLPEIFEGSNSIYISILTVVASTAVSCFCIGGLSNKTFLNIVSTVIGTVTAGILFYIIMLVLRVSGNSIAEAENLILISKITDMRLTGVLFAGVLVSALGAVMDVAVSMGASLHEIKELNPDIAPKDLFRSGMNIGRDMIGTMTDTLILAFTGGAFASLMVLLSYGIQFHQLMSSNFIALEIATGIAGSAAVVLTVPISAAVCSYSLKK